MAPRSRGTWAPAPPGLTRRPARPAIAPASSPGRIIAHAFSMGGEGRATTFHGKPSRRHATCVILGSARSCDEAGVSDRAARRTLENMSPASTQPRQPGRTADHLCAGPGTLKIVFRVDRRRMGLSQICDNVAAPAHARVAREAVRLRRLADPSSSPGRSVTKIICVYCALFMITNKTCLIYNWDG